MCTWLCVHTVCVCTYVEGHLINEWTVALMGYLRMALFSLSESLHHLGTLPNAHQQEDPHQAQTSTLLEMKAE